MLQGLFDEDGVDGECKLNVLIKLIYTEKIYNIIIAGYQVTTSTGSKSTVEKPLPPRNETNLSGLQNQGATW